MRYAIARIHREAHLLKITSHVSWHNLTNLAIVLRVRLWNSLNVGSFVPINPILAVLFSFNDDSELD